MLPKIYEGESTPEIQRWWNNQDYSRGWNDSESRVDWWNKVAMQYHFPNMGVMIEKTVSQVEMLENTVRDFELESRHPANMEYAQAAMESVYHKESACCGGCYLENADHYCVLTAEW